MFDSVGTFYFSGDPKAHPPKTNKINALHRVVIDGVSNQDNSKYELVVKMPCKLVRSKFYEEI